MPSAIIAAGSFIVSAIGTVSAAITAAGIVGKIALYAGLTALSYAAQRAFQKKPTQPAPEDVQQSVKQGVQPRIRHYGRVKASGPWMFAGTESGDFHKVIAIAHGEIDAVESLWIDDNQVTVDGSGVVAAAPHNSKLIIQYTTGQASETAFPDLVSKFSDYTTNHKGNGIALLYAQQLAVSQSAYFKTFPNGVNSVYLAVLRGTKVYNPYTATTAWSDNAALVIRDYMISSDGMRLPSALVSTALANSGWIVAYNKCNEDVDLDAGGTEKRYRIWGSHTLQEPPGDVIARMLRACDGRLMPTPDGGVKLVVKTYSEPSVTITADDVTEITELCSGFDIEQRPNTIRASYTETNVGYQTADADPWADDADVTARGIEVRDIDLIMSPSHTQTRRLMKREFYRANPRWTGKFSLNKGGMALIGETACRVVLAEYGINHVFEINDLSLDVGEGNVIVGVTVDLTEIPSAAFDWDETTEEGVAPVSTVTTDGTTIPVPTGFTVTMYGGAGPYAVLEADTPPSLSLRLEGRYKPTAGSEWFAVQASNISDTTSLQTPTLTDGTEYEFQIRHVSISQTAGAWTSSILRTAVSDSVAPAVIISPAAAAGGTGEVDLTWTTPNSANYSRVVVRRNSVDVEGGAAEIADSPIYGAANTAGALTETGLAAGDYYYWLYAANASGVESAGVATGVVTAT